MKDRWLDSFFKQIDRTQAAWDHEQEFMLQVVSGEPMTLFGQRVEVTLNFPDGKLPLGKSTMEEFQAEMREWLARHRENMADRKARRAA